ncbi:MAG TPA: nuclear transport factor 2 family protein [Gemmatimonadaceae bacterium]
MRFTLVPIAAAVVLSGCASVPQGADLGSLRQQVTEAERAFARTMADRDHAAFTSHLADEAVFFAGEAPVRGKEAVAADWKRFFEGPAAPFSWEPDRVEVLESGSLALSTGPVYDPAGKIIGRFNSIWRREASGQWRVVFDKGSPVCPPPSASSQ